MHQPYIHTKIGEIEVKIAEIAKQLMPRMAVLCEWVSLKGAKRIFCHWQISISLGFWQEPIDLKELYLLVCQHHISC